MDEAPRHTLSKEERLCGKRAISALMAGGRWGSCMGLKFCCLRNTGESVDRIMTTVPKRLFKRAVKRNLLKRRLREAWRTQKHLFTAEGGTDIMFLYNTQEIMSSEQVAEAVRGIISQIESWN